jgi:hypothetical protein
MAMVRLFVLFGALLLFMAVVVTVVVIVVSNRRSRQVPPTAQPGWPQGVGQAPQWPGQQPTPGVWLPLPPADQVLQAGQPPLAGQQPLAAEQPLAGQGDPGQDLPPPPEGRPSD